MRILLAIPLLAAAACNVTRDDANNTVGIEINEEVAANTAANVSNTVENVAQDVGNEAQELGEKVRNTDVDVNVNQDVKTENKQQ